MKTRPLPTPAPEQTPAETNLAVFTVDQRVLFSAQGQQRTSMPLVIAMVVACEYVRTGKAFDIVDLDDERIIAFDGKDILGTEPLDGVLYAMARTIGKVVEKSVLEALHFLAGAEAAAKVAGERPEQATAAPEQAAQTPQ